jgi:NitT/TauT family transport system permease protein
MASSLVETPPVETPLPKEATTKASRVLGWVRHGLAVSAPIVAVLIAMTLHRVLPNRQNDLPSSWYPILLEKILMVAIVLFIAHFFWKPLRNWLRYTGPLFAGGVLVLCLWDVCTLKMNWLQLPWFPGPDAVLRAMQDDREKLWVSTQLSLRLLVAGYFSGAIAGVITGVLIGWFRILRYWGMPVLKVVGPIPATALVPLAMVLFTNSFLSGTSLIAMAVWFPVTMLTISGIANVPVSYLDVARTFGASRCYLIFRVAIPAALPSIFIGLFMGLGASFLTLMVAETVGVKDGLGYYLAWRKGTAEFAHVWGALVIMAAFFSTIMTLLFKARDWVLVWQRGVIRW